jgi:hypothetical protein
MKALGGLEILNLDFSPSWHLKAALGALLACVAAFLLALKILHLA